MRRAFLVCACMVACNAFSEDLRPRDGVGGDGGVGEGATEGGLPAVDQEAKLIAPDDGSHRALVATNEAFAWSTSKNAKNGLRIFGQSLAEGSAPQPFAPMPCGADTLSGYLFASGERIFASNEGCFGWLCYFDAANPKQLNCAYDGNSGFYRLAGDAAGGLASEGGDGADKEHRLRSFSPTFDSKVVVAQGDVDVPDLSKNGSIDFTASTNAVYWTEVVEGSMLRVMVCGRPLSKCQTPAEILKPRAGAPVAIAATDDSVFVAYETSDRKSRLVRVTAGVEAPFATPSASIGTLKIAGTNLVWNEGASMERAALDGSGKPEVIGHAPNGEAITHLAATPDGTKILLMTSQGVYRLDLRK